MIFMRQSPRSVHTVIRINHCSSSSCRIFYALATGIWEDAAYANYVSIVEHGNNRMVGWLEGLEGLCSLFFAIPFGSLADRWRRDRVLRISSCIELGALATCECGVAIVVLQNLLSCHTAPTSVVAFVFPALRQVASAVHSCPNVFKDGTHNFPNKITKFQGFGAYHRKHGPITADLQHVANLCQSSLSCTSAL